MAEKKDFLVRYAEYVEQLAKDKSPQLFTNGGIEYASVLMSVLFNHTEREARVFCQGFKPDLIKTSPYWKALNDYLNKAGNVLRVLVETDEYADKEPIQLLKSKMLERNDESIQIRVASSETVSAIYRRFGDKSCNFSIFDDNKFRFENEPDGYKAFGSFNRPDYAGVLISIFDKAFEDSRVLN